MKLLEYEAKAILSRHGIAVPNSTVVRRADARLITPIVLKSQVPVGGRGKLGGVVIVEKSEDIAPTLERLLALDIKGHKPAAVLAEEKLAIAREHYVSLLVDRNTASIRLVAHPRGGVEVEDNTSAGFLSVEIITTKITVCAEKLAAHLGYEPNIMTPLLTKLYETFVANDATLLEINPLVFTKNGELVCGDCKMELDDAASFRHPEWDFEDKPQNTNFVVLDPHGMVATIANGAGLAMATVDAVAARGMTPANFLDIGGGANEQSVLAAFEKIVAFPEVKAIVINIFAGITRCDEVAKAIVAARQQITLLPPLFIRLAGTNYEAAAALLEAEHITTLASLDDALTTAQEAIRA